MKFRGLIGKFLRSLQFGKSGNFKINHKFPKLNKNDIQKRFNNLLKFLKLIKN